MFFERFGEGVDVHIAAGGCHLLDGQVTLDQQLGGNLHPIVGKIFLGGDAHLLAEQGIEVHPVDVDVLRQIADADLPVVKIVDVG